MRSLELLAILGICVIAAACGDDTSPESGDGGASGSGGGSAGSTSGNGGGGAAAALTPSELFPLASGNAWTYTVPASFDGSPCMPGMRTVTATGPTTFQQKQAFLVEDLCRSTGTQYAVEGGEVYEWVDGFWAKALPAPVAAGYTWITTGVGSFAWESVSSITVPAGTFTNCWARTTTDDGTNELVFCPGVGVVQMRSFGRNIDLTARSLR